MAERDFENGRIFNFQHHALTLTWDWAIWYTVVHHSLTSTYTPNFIRIGETLWMDTFGQTYVCRTYGRTRCLSVRTYVHPYLHPTDVGTDARMYGQTDIEAGFIRLTRRNRPKKSVQYTHE